MRTLLIGFVAGLLLGASVWAAGPPAPVDPGVRSRPDRQWDQDRGYSLREWMQQRQQEGLFQRQQHDLLQEIDRLEHRPC